MARKAASSTIAATLGVTFRRSILPHLATGVQRCRPSRVDLVPRELLRDARGGGVGLAVHREPAAAACIIAQLCVGESEAAYAERSRKKDAEWEWVVDLDTMVELPVDLRRGRPGCTKEHCLDLSSTS